MSLSWTFLQTLATRLTGRSARTVRRRPKRPMRRTLRMETFEEREMMAAMIVVSGSLAYESDGHAVFTVSTDIDAPAPDGISVNVITSETTDTSVYGPATSGLDYTHVSRTVTIPAGTTSVQFSVPISADSLTEMDEAFLVLLSGATGNATIVEDTGQGVIRDGSNPAAAGPDIEVKILATQVVIQDDNLANPIGFGNVTVGQSASITFEVRNTGDAVLNLYPIGSLAAGFSLLENFGSTSLAPQASTTFKIGFAPTEPGRILQTYRSATMT